MRASGCVCVLVLGVALAVRGCVFGCACKWAFVGAYINVDECWAHLDAIKVIGM